MIANPPVESTSEGDGSWVLPFWREAALLPYGEGEMCMPGRDEGPGVLVTYDRGRSWDERGGPHLTQTRLTHLIEGSVALVDDEVGLGFRV